MKKIFLLVIIIIVASACEDYEHTPCSTSKISGAELRIDSAQFKPVLLKVDERDGKILYIYDGKGITEVRTLHIVDIVTTAICAILFTLFIVAIIENAQRY